MTGHVYRMFTHAIVRLPGENFAAGLTTSELGRPSFPKMLAQHEFYVNTLRALGLEVIALPAEPAHPDAYFVEDPAVVTPAVAIITNPGAAARRGEQDTLEPVLARYRQIAHIRPPGTMDGGDVLMVGKHFFVGISERTNEEGASQFGRILEEHDYSWTAVPLGDGLHLKSSVNYVGADSDGADNLLITEAFADREVFQSYDKIILAEEEVYASNTLLVNDTLIMPKGFPKTRRQLEGLGKKIVELDVSEAQKMDGGLTCMSLRFRHLL